jgi:recombination protein RecT
VTGNLRTRAAGGQVATRPQAAAPTLAGMIEQLKPEIQRALPKHLDPDRMARIALTVLRQTPALAATTPESFLGALMTCAQLGLEPGPLGEAYLVPYGKVCTFIPGYQGLVKLAYQSGAIEWIYADRVLEGDHFVEHKGSDPRVEHERPPLGTKRGATLGYYAVAKIKGAGTVHVVMDRHEIDEIRKRSRASGSGPWVTDYDEMAKKTVLRRLTKTLPKSPMLQAALANEGTVRTDTSETAIDVPAVDYITGEITDPPAADDMPVEDPPEEPDWPDVAPVGEQ